MRRIGFLYAVILSTNFLADVRIATADECSLAKTNRDCTFTLDRRHPLAPPAIQMYPGQTVTVELRKPYYFERYFLDFSTGQTALAPDTATSIVNGLLTPLQKAAELRLAAQAPPAGQLNCSPENIKGNTPTNNATTIQADSLYSACLKDFASQAKAIYQALEPAVAPDSWSPQASPFDSNTDFKDDLDKLPAMINTAYTEEFQLSASIAVAGKIDPSTLNADALSRIEALTAIAGLADGVAKDLFAYRARILDLPALPHGGCAYPDRRKEPARELMDTDTCITLGSIQDPNIPNQKLTTRQVTYNIDALNLVQNSQIGVPDPSKKKTLAALTILYGDARWEASAGTFFSTLPVRSFPVNSIFTNGVVTDKQIGQSVTHPTIVPFAAANFRLTRDLACLKWRSAVYWTFAVGVNPNTTTADVASGPSISFRGLMFSALWHYGHDVRLTQGLYTGESLGAGFNGAASTTTYWRNAFAIGISVRAPSLTGR